MSGFKNFEIEGGFLKSILAIEDYELDDLMDSIAMNSDLSENKMEKMKEYIEENELTAAFVANLKVDENARGKGLGRQLMNLFENETAKNADIKILFARTLNKQAKGFDLESFYEGYGFKGLVSECGDLLMVSKSHHEALDNKLGMKEERKLILDYYSKNKPSSKEEGKMVEFSKRREQESERHKRSTRFKNR